jgi:hypothetical protein
LNRWQVSFPINGLHDVIEGPNSELTIDKVKFRCYENGCLGRVIVNADSEKEAKDEAKYMTDKSLAWICFAYNTETSIDISGCYVKKLINYRWCGTRN